MKSQFKTTQSKTTQFKTTQSIQKSLLLPEHIDVIPINYRVEQNLIVSGIKKYFDLENYHYNNNTLDNNNLSVIIKRPYLITFNTGRQPYWLYFVKKNNHQVAYLIDKKLRNFWQIKSPFSPTYYQKGTLFEVCLLKVEDQIPSYLLTLKQQLHLMDRSNHYLILIHDIVMLNGKNLTNVRLNDRYHQTIEMFKSSNYQYNPCDLIEYQFKPYVQYLYLESLWFDYRQQVNYLNDITGIILSPLETVLGGNHTNYLYFINNNLKRPERVATINVKPSQNVNLLLKTTGQLDHYQLYAKDRHNNLKYIDIALVNDLITSRMLQSTMEGFETRVFSCQFDNDFKKWKPISLTDKEQPDIINQLTEKWLNSSS